MSEVLPTVVLSRDRRFLVKVEAFEGTIALPDRDAIAYRFNGQLTPGVKSHRINVLYDPLVVEDFRPEDFGLQRGLQKDSALDGIALWSISETLGSKELWTSGDSDSRPWLIACHLDRLIEVSNRSRPEDAEILTYLAFKLYQGWRFDLPEGRFSLADCLILGTTLSEIRRVAFLHEDQFWRTTHQSQGISIHYAPTPELLRDVEQGKIPGLPSKPQQGPLLDQLSAPRYRSARDHLLKAVAFSDEGSDLPNAAKEAACAVEALAKVVTDKHADTLGEIIKSLKASKKVDSALAKSFESLWGFTSSSPGVRHGGATPSTITKAEVQFILGQAETTMMYLLTLDL